MTFISLPLLALARMARLNLVCKVAFQAGVSGRVRFSPKNDYVVGYMQSDGVIYNVFFVMLERKMPISPPSISVHLKLSSTFLRQSIRIESIYLTVYITVLH